MNKSRILLIDDDLKALSPLVELLREKYNYEVIWQSSPNCAIPIIKNESFDAIILDIMMPVPDLWSETDTHNADRGLATGLVLFRKIRDIRPTIPILIYSARPFTIGDSYTAYLGKPEMSELIDRYLQDLITQIN